MLVLDQTHSNSLHLLRSSRRRPFILIWTSARKLWTGEATAQPLRPKPTSGPLLHNECNKIPPISQGVYSHLGRWVDWKNSKLNSFHRFLDQPKQMTLGLLDNWEVFLFSKVSVSMTFLLEEIQYGIDQPSNTI